METAVNLRGVVLRSAVQSEAVIHGYGHAYGQSRFGERDLRAVSGIFPGGKGETYAAGFLGFVVPVQFIGTVGQKRVKYGVCVIVLR